MPLRAQKDFARRRPAARKNPIVPPAGGSGFRPHDEDECATRKLRRHALANVPIL
jgi:hypothetical protein